MRKCKRIIYSARLSNRLIPWSCRVRGSLPSLIPFHHLHNITLCCIRILHYTLHSIALNQTTLHLIRPKSALLCSTKTFLITCIALKLEASWYLWITCVELQCKTIHCSGIWNYNSLLMLKCLTTSALVALRKLSYFPFQCNSILERNRTLHSASARGPNPIPLTPLIPSVLAIWYSQEPRLLLIVIQ